LVLGLVALSQIKKQGQSGRGLAIGGVAANGALLAISALIIAAAVILAATADDTDDFDGFTSSTTFSIPG